MAVITIARQYGSLGDEIARDVARQLEMHLVDQEIINQVASRLGVAAETVTERDEREPSLVSDLVRTLRRLYPGPLPRAAGQATADLDESQYLQVIREVVTEVARARSVIVGRGASLILGQQPDVVHVLLVAPFDTRVERIMTAEGLSRQGAVQRVRHVDEDRARYIRHFYGADWLGVNQYNMVLDTGHFTPGEATSLICAAVPKARENG
jgi:cytidylate kinase